jgi:hypothetical protein
MIFGETPFGDGVNEKRRRQKILSARVTYRSGTAPEVRQFLEMLLVREPRERGDFEAVKNSELMRGIDEGNGLGGSGEKGIAAAVCAAAGGIGEFRSAV